MLWRSLDHAPNAGPKPGKQPGPSARVRQWFAAALRGPHLLAFLPACSLGAYWLAGETALIVAALVLPLLFALAGFYEQQTALPGCEGAPRDILRCRMAEIYSETALTGSRSACFVIDIGDLDTLAAHRGQSAADLVVDSTAERIAAAVDDRGLSAQISDTRFAVVLHATADCDLEGAIQLAGALHAAVEGPIVVSGAPLNVACTIGFALRDQITGGDSDAWIDAARGALTEARASGPSGIRAYSAELRRKLQIRTDLQSAASRALENGEIRPWFQPQISTDTGKVTGFEALARWVHPDHGLVAPDMFLPVMEDAGLLARLGEVILRGSLEAVQDWDQAGVRVPRVGVNFAGDELSNPHLVDKVRWELDRFDLKPDRLSIEILETVVTDASHGIVTRNIAGLAALGCRIDLDDFGTGHASIAAVRRFAVSRLKIDRDFVTRADRDQQQQRLIAAILKMAEQLGLETLAEGVETAGEHALLAQLGCDHVQGFGIGRPMPKEKTLSWIRTHEAGLQNPPRIGGGTG